MLLNPVFIAVEVDQQRFAEPRQIGRQELVGSRCVCQLDLAHFDAFIWPTPSANDLSGAGRSGALRRGFLRRV